MSVSSLSILPRQTLDEEARAEVDVLNSRLDKTTQLTRKIQTCLGRLEASGHSVNEVAGPLSGETRRLQLLENNVDAVLSAIGRLRHPADSKDDEELIIRAGPDKAGLSNYLASIKRLGKAFADMQASNLRANQQSLTELVHLIKSGNTQLEFYFDKLLRGETPPSIEPLHYITKEMAFPPLSRDKTSRLSVICSYLASAQQGYETSPAKCQHG
ncbi:hypothetical protein RJ55_05847 [Drechmeria coniospora]|nr:hypothetical protein RJ55_05847 [Drechmeria coniospora]